MDFIPFDTKISIAQGSGIKYLDDESEIEVWCCSYCNKEFDTEKGALFHENKYCKKKYR